MDLVGQAVGGDFAFERKIVLSADGERVAIAARTRKETTTLNYVVVYEWTGSVWIQLGANLHEEAGNDRLGDSLALSGHRVAIGAPWNDGNGDRSGHVRIFEFTKNNWNQVGQDLDDIAAWEQSGSSVALSSNGNRVVIMADRWVTFAFSNGPRTGPGFN